MIITAKIRLICEGWHNHQRCENEIVVSLRRVNYRDMRDALDDLARQQGWGSHRVCAECAAEHARESALCDKGDAERLEREFS